MIVKFIIPLGDERVIHFNDAGTILASGKLAIVRAESIETARNVLTDFCREAGLHPWAHAADVEILDEKEGVIAYAG